MKVAMLYQNKIQKYIVLAQVLNIEYNQFSFGTSLISTMNLRTLSADLQKVATEQLGEDPARIAEDLQALKTWIEQQPHLTANTDDQFLIAFLRGCKYSLEKAKAKIDKFYTLKGRFPEIFGVCDIDNERIREILRTGIVTVLPEPLNGNGPRIFCVRSGVYPADKYSIEEIFSVICIVLQIVMLEDDCATINGIVLINNFQDVTMAHFLQYTPSIAKKWITFVEHALPLRPKTMNFINTPSGFDTVYNVAKALFTPKIKERLYVHGSDMDSLMQNVPRKYLPIEYGGENGSFNEIVAVWEKKFDQYSQYFKDCEDYGTNELLRPGKAIDFETMFGMEGSFRKLDVD